MKTIKKHLKHQAISQTFFAPTTLGKAIQKLGFVQADPIRAPARAQDLTLRHRVKGYIVGDLERLYPTLPIDEDYLYAYGFVDKNLRGHLYPRVNKDITEFDQRVLAVVTNLGEAHPKALDQYFGRERVVNGWGGHSKATKRALERLHYAGHLRVASRKHGIRIYTPTEPMAEAEPLEARKKKIVLAIVNILSPVALLTLNQALHGTRHFLGETKTAVSELIGDGALVKEIIDGISYIWPREEANEEAAGGVKILTPFDPLVWDRVRFEHLWGWQYRFEAYTPKAKRVRGYYAMPILWNTEIIGWVNINIINKKLNTEMGFIKERPKSKQFEKDLKHELSQMELFLKS